MNKISKLENGEGGAHMHQLENSEKTLRDGSHKHLFFVNDRLLMSDLDGSHIHLIDASKNQVGPEIDKHNHSVHIRTEDGMVGFETEVSPESHDHELQTNETTISGLHTHIVTLGDDSYISLLPGDLINEVEQESQKYPSLKYLKIPKNISLESNFQLQQKLNRKELSQMLKKAVEKTIIKRLTRLSDGLRIESLVLSRERFGDIGIATRFVLDNGLQIRESKVLENEGVFTFKLMARDRFSESSLQRIRITEGVDAIIGFLLENELEQQTTEGQEILEGSLDEFKDKGDEMETLKEKFNKTMGLYQVEKKIEKKVRTFQIFKRDDDKRLVTGPVLIPENIDLQDDIISPEEIEFSAHNYMVKLAFANDMEFLKDLGLSTKSERGFMHTEFSRKVAVVETFLAPVEFSLNNRIVTKGTWVMTMKVFDDEAWALIKSNRITGFSIGGRSKSRIEDI